ncbi:D-alanine--D-alanine ligase [Neisseria meningitidis serogroup B]|uniref:D-alanine--D-alanine ligase n=2 Tax=Neisseria meningitidis TaxID=487 RepID=A0A0H5QCT3_NEIMI|nr:hypothetical protein NMALPHA522_0463 [Neisseria meningitidis alpha522]CRY99301.1 D-alanine--D-alanine ligase [Neisseria meningitidis serogroup B]
MRHTRLTDGTSYKDRLKPQIRFQTTSGNKHKAIRKEQKQCRILAKWPY